jgi:hypothetical protein
VGEWACRGSYKSTPVSRRTATDDRYNEVVTHYGAAIKHALRRALPLALTAALPLAGCKKDDLGATGVRLEVHTNDTALLPSALRVQWFDDRDRLLEVRVPSNGRLPEASAAKVSVYISMADQMIGPRRVLVYGLDAQEMRISEGAMRLTPVAGQWTGFTVTMDASGSLPDADHDGMPDEIDNCPTRPHPCADEPGPDGAAPDSPVADASGERGRDVGDGGVDAPVDRGDALPPDVPPSPDVAPADLMPDKPTEPVNGNGTGVRGDYYDASNFTSYKTSRLDAKIDIDWMNGSPIPGTIGTDTFSIRWLGSVQPRYSETYTFYVQCDDGVRLFFNNAMLIDAWAGPAKMEFMASTTPLVGGNKYDFRVEYYENTGGASCHVSWSSPSQPKEIVPTSQLYPPPNDGGV